MTTARFASVMTIAALLLLTPGPAHAGRAKALKCAFAKQQVAVDEIDAILGCQRKALRAQSTVDPACVETAMNAFGEAFQDIETKGGCAISGDATLVERIVERSAQELGVELQGSCSASGQECGGLNPPCCAGLACRAVLDGGGAFCGPASAQ